MKKSVNLDLFYRIVDVGTSLAIGLTSLLSSNNDTTNGVVGIVLVNIIWLLVQFFTGIILQVLLGDKVKINEEKTAKKKGGLVWGETVVEQVVFLLGGLLGLYLAKYDPRLVWLVRILTLLTIGVVAKVITEVERRSGSKKSAIANKAIVSMKNAGIKSLDFIKTSVLFRYGAVTDLSLLLTLMLVDIMLIAIIVIVIFFLFCEFKGGVFSKVLSGHSPYSSTPQIKYFSNHGPDREITKIVSSTIRVTFRRFLILKHQKWM